MGFFRGQQGKQPCIPVNKRDGAFHSQHCLGLPGTCSFCCMKRSAPLQHPALLVQHRLALPAQLYPLPLCTAINAVGQQHLGIGKASTSSHPVPVACTHLALSTHSPSFPRGQHHNSPCLSLSQLSAAPACLAAGWEQIYLK